MHIVHSADGRIIPFDTYNLFYRDERERELTARLREPHGILVPLSIGGRV